MKKFFLALLFISGFFALCVQGQDKDTSIYLKKMFYRGNDSMPYRILLPRDYDSSKKYPLVLFLHGKGERGNDNMKQLTWGSRLFVQGNIRRRYPAIVVFPQCSENGYWSNVKRTTDKKSGKDIFEFRPDGEPTRDMDMLMSLHKELLSTYPVDSSRLYVMGLSMGGMGTFEIVRRLPTTFAEAIPIAGGADTTTAKIIKNTAFWIFHGANDDVVPTHFSEDMVKALQGFYSTAAMQYTVYSGTGHNSWEKAFADPELMPWLFSHRRTLPK
jgi:predicted peptidase